MWINKLIKNNKYLLYFLFIFLISCIFLSIKNKLNKDKTDFSKDEYNYIHKILLENLKKTIQIFDKYNLHYWASEGTLLGSIREKSIIKYDDDIDISILKEDYMRLIYDKNIRNDLNNLGLHLIIPEDITTYQIIKIVTQNKNNDYTKNKIFIDIMPRHKNNNRYILSEKHARNVWPNSYFNDNELFPLKKNKLNNLTINIPNNPIPYLNRRYGDCKNKDCWKIPDMKKPHHLKEINLEI